MLDWYPGAVVLLGPASKAGYPSVSVRDGRGAVLHSMEGGLAAAHGVLSGPAQSSWHFSNPKVGPLEQHYAISRITWHGGSLGANRRYVGIEHEGVAGEPLTASQIENDVALLGWLAENDVQPWSGLIRLDTLWEHNEMTRYGSKATACPSGRIPWQEVIDMVTIDYVARAAAEAAQKKADQNAYRSRIAGLILSGDGETAYREMQALRKFTGLPLVVV